VNLGALTILLVLGLVGFNSSFGGWAYLIPAGGGLAAGLAIGWFTLRRGWSVLTAAGLSLMAFLLLGGPLAIPETTIAGVVPTAATLTGLFEGAVRGWKELITTAPPVGSTPPLLVVPLITGLVGGVLGARLALSSLRPAVPLIAPLAVLAAGILVGTRFPVSVMLQGALFGVIAYGWVAWRTRTLSNGVNAAAETGVQIGRLGAAAALITAAGVLAVPLAPALPLAEARPRFTLREATDPPFEPYTFATPLGSIRKYSTAAKDKTLFVVSGLPEGSYLRLAAMDTYDGVVFGVAGVSTGTNAASGSFERVGSQLTQQPQSTAYDVTVRVQDYQDYWLPSAGDVALIEFAGPRSAELAEGFRYNRATGTGLTQPRLSAGDEYRLTVTMPTLPPEEGRAALDLSDAANSQAAPSIEALKKLQGQLQQDLAADGPQSLYEQITGMAAALKEQGFYSNGDSASGRPPSLSGHGTARLSKFAATEPLIGDEEQYAASAALLTSYLGVPVRVVMGALAPAGSEEGWEVKGSDVTAWIEVALGESWIPVQVLPEKNKPLPQTQEVQQRPQLAPQQPLPPPPPDTSEAISASDVEAPESQEEPEGGWKIPAGVLTAAKFIGIPLLIAGSLIGGMALAKASRRRRRRSTGAGVHRIAGGWSEVRDLARDYGSPVPVHGTRREAAAAIQADGATLLANRADEAVFGPEQPDDGQAEQYWQQVDEFHTALRQGYPWYRRLQAVLSLNSWRSR
jgi:hypothetical protein